MWFTFNYMNSRTIVNFVLQRPQLSQRVNAMHICRHMKVYAIYFMTENKSILKIRILQRLGSNKFHVRRRGTEQEVGYGWIQERQRQTKEVLGRGDQTGYDTIAVYREHDLRQEGAENTNYGRKLAGKSPSHTSRQECMVLLPLLVVVGLLLQFLDLQCVTIYCIVSFDQSIILLQYCSVTICCFCYHLLSLILPLRLFLDFLS